MKIVTTELADILIIELDSHCDERGQFVELLRQDQLGLLGLPSQFVQVNWSHSRCGVLRGLHYQLERPQGKLIHVIAGSIFDVAVDLRRSSPTFGRVLSLNLSADKPSALYLPPGIAHGMLVLSEWADVIYHCTCFYSPATERTLAWNDLELAIPWPLNGPPLLSAKDSTGTSFAESEFFS
jgi:dTDP-4-dehydrorhamnose 3,5-epimerase